MNYGHTELKHKCIIAIYNDFAISPSPKRKTLDNTQMTTFAFQVIVYCWNHCQSCSIHTALLF